MDNTEKLATLGTQDKDKQMLENTKGEIKNGQYRETGNIRYTRRRPTKQKNNAICVRHHYTQTKTSKLNKS